MEVGNAHLTFNFTHLLNAIALNNQPLQEGVAMRLHRLTPQQYRNRQALLNKVKNYWVKGVLETSLHNRVLIDLNLEERPEAVAHPIVLNCYQQGGVVVIIPWILDNLRCL